jgi:hypothetical protein
MNGIAIEVLISGILPINIELGITVVVQDQAFVDHVERPSENETAN